MTTEQNLEFIRQQKQQEKNRHEREKLALEQRQTSEKQRHQTNIQNLKTREQTLLNSKQTSAIKEYLDELGVYPKKLLNELAEVLKYYFFEKHAKCNTQNY